MTDNIAPGKTRHFTHLVVERQGLRNDRARNARLWVTVGHGIVNEIYWPSTGGRSTATSASTSSARTAGSTSSGSAATRCRSRRLPAAPHHRPSGRRLPASIDVLPDPRRDALLAPLCARWPLPARDRRAPHLGATGHDNTAWVEDGALHAAIRARRPASPPTSRCQLSVGYVGASDGWQDLARNGRFTHAFRRAAEGNVAMTASLAARRGSSRWRSADPGGGADARPLGPSPRATRRCAPASSRAGQHGSVGSPAALNPTDRR